MGAREPDPPAGYTEHGGPPRVDLGALGFELDDDSWMERLREADDAFALGSIGPYELLDEVSRGGQGVVFRARQPQTHREIAIKRLLAGNFASTRMRRRFEREVEAAAALNHPGIVTVYGLDVVDGVPLIAMEWVEGESVTSWAQSRSDTGELLELFLRICDAVQHAHSRGVVHRDLKPSNILVDAAGQPHVLDFGLAKRAADEVDDFTVSGSFVGTPGYASPEQLRGDGGAVDVRTDVFALGVILYEMLTHRHPWGARGSLTELIRALETEDPPRPSQIDPRLPRELDLIAAKALAREHLERYPTVSALAADVRHHLADEPIVAAPPSKGYLLRKLVKRNRTVFGFSLAIAGLSIAFAAVAWWQALELSDQVDAARRAQGEAERQEERALASEAELRQTLLAVSRAREEADDQATRADAVVQYLLEDIFRYGDPDYGVWNLRVREALALAANRVDARFEEQPEMRAHLHALHGRLLHGAGEYAEAERHLRSALGVYETIPAEVERRIQSRNVLAMLLIDRGNAPDGEVLVWESLEEAEAHFEGDHVDLAATFLALGRARHLQRDLDGAERWIRLGLEMEQRLELPPSEEHVRTWLQFATVLDHVGKGNEAAEVTDRAIAVARLLAPASGSRLLADALFRRGQLHDEAGELAAAIEALREAHAMEAAIVGPDSPASAVNAAELGHLLRRDGQVEEAREMLEGAVRTMAAADGANPAQLATVRLWLGDLYRARDELGRARGEYEHALRAFEAQHGDDWPSTASAHYGLAQVHLQRGDFLAACDHFVLARRIFERTRGRVHVETLEAWIGEAASLRATGRIEECVDASRRTVELVRVLRPDDPIGPLMLLGIGRMCLELGRFEEAADASEQARDLLRAAGRTDGREVELAGQLIAAAHGAMETADSPVQPAPGAD